MLLEQENLKQRLNAETAKLFRVIAKLFRVPTMTALQPE
jgi:hypothetical protein